MRSTQPVPGWYRDPYAPDQLRYWDGRGWTPGVARLTQPGGPPGPPPLDQLVAEQRAFDPRPWGWRPAVLPLAAMVIIGATATAIMHIVRPHTFAADYALTSGLNLVIYLALGFVIWYAARDIAVRYGGWGPAFGLRRPIRKDIGYIASGIGISFIARIVIGALANGLTNGRAGQQSQNLRLHTASVAVDILLVIVVVILAPVLEEIIFRGLLLRTFMRRMAFWPAALLSTFIFAIFHTYEVSTLAGAITLALVVGSLGLLNCVLVRLTARLAPGMYVHAAFNALATTVIIYQASH